MDPGILIKELEQLALALGVELRYEDLEERAGGLCRFGGRSYLIINRRLSAAQRLELFRQNLSRLPLDEVFLRPHLREWLGAAAGEEGFD